MVEGPGKTSDSERSDDASDLETDFQTALEVDDALPPATRAALQRALARDANDEDDDDSTVSIEKPGVDTGAFFGPFAMLLELGRGGPLHSHLAADAEGVVVLKFADSQLPAQSEAHAVLEHEARLGDLVDHDNIVRQLDTGFERGRRYIVFELVEGLSAEQLEVLVDTVPERAVVEIGLGVARALRYLASVEEPSEPRVGLVHRDVCPSNILLSKDGKVKLADLGIATFEGRAESGPAGPPPGRVAYMAPEQLRQEPIDARADLHSLGVVLVELLTGTALRPDGYLMLGDPVAVVRSRLAEARVHGEFAALLGSLTNPVPDRRPQSAQALVDALGRIRNELGGPVDLGALVRQVVRDNIPGAEWPEPDPARSSVHGDTHLIKNVPVSAQLLGDSVGLSEPLSGADDDAQAIAASIDPTQRVAALDSVSTTDPRRRMQTMPTGEERRPLVPVLVGLLIVSWVAIVVLVLALLRR